jgi:hypothetical protein
MKHTIPSKTEAPNISHKSEQTVEYSWLPWGGGSAREREREKERKRERKRKRAPYISHESEQLIENLYSPCLGIVKYPSNRELKL